MNYGVGDQVVCIDAQPPDDPEFLFAGRTYVVALANSTCTAVEGVEWEGCCPKCASYDGWDHFEPWRFIKLPEVTARNEVTSEAEAV